MKTVRAKKKWGQHFLTNTAIAEKIADSPSYSGYTHLLEVGPGTGMLTQFLIQKPLTLTALEIDSEAHTYLNAKYLQLGKRLILADFLKFDLKAYYKNEAFGVIGNFPYNLSSQILFKVLEHRHQIPEMCAMFQKEVGQRICHQKGNKIYGILSVLTQAFYTAEYLFTVSEKEFSPQPKVKSAVIRLTRKEPALLNCDEKLFFSVVKTAFNQRRKTLRNSLKSFGLSAVLKEDSIFDRRPETLDVNEFVMLTRKIKDDSFSTKR